ncbi:LacI family DNA-binding transcriptional regulator [Ferrimonas balearica]|uniref:LacI family DNA-binding transcriptional regulator n=1 Tax=Ferrimonas balearica TaxID=44012 RepID=UPI001C99ADE3|nr:LacI family DNA-binding transcriptional regulator [Ferrimonas balearica]MBY5992657.1 LacI family DNA-binding transcriptional regulator [Ferrimonas balearica]
MKITIKDVAQKAGVSIKTVSRVINNEPSVKANTFEKVQAAIEALNYQPNAAARNLAGTKAYAIGFIYDNPNAYYVIDMQNGILDACRRHGYELLIHPCDAKAENICQQLTGLVSRSRVAGLVLTPPFSETPAIVNTLEQLDVAFVRIVSGSGDGDVDPNCLYIDDRQGAYAITEHLISLGHQRIGFLCGDSEHHSSYERLKGFKQALGDHRIKVEPELIVDGRYAFDSGVENAQALLALANPPTAMFACNDEIAAGALFAARLSGVAIPGQLSIVGFENSPFSRQTWPKLTTVDQPIVGIAQQATEQLLNQIRGQVSGEAQKFVPQPITRDSSGPRPD